MSGETLLRGVLTSLWLGALLAPAALLLMHAWPRLAARQRHAAWWVVLIAIVLAPLATDRRTDGRTDSGGGQAGGQVTASARQTVQPSDAATASAPSEENGSPAAAAGWSLHLPSRAPQYFLLVWVLGAIAGALVLLREFIVLSRIRRSAYPPSAPLLALWKEAIASLPTRRVLRLLVSDQVELPAACGYIRPAVLVPRRLEGMLDDAEMRHLLLHELAHLAWRDDWSLAIERAIRVVWWWNPIVWWIARKLDAERELACDAAVASRVDRRTYARTLLRVAELSLSRPDPELAPSILRGRLATRIEALVRPAPKVAHLARAGAAAVATVAVAGVSLGPPSLRVSVKAPTPVATIIAPPVAVVRRDAAGMARGQGLALDSLFTRFADSGFSGTVLVAFGEDVILEKGYGLADRERGIPATAETRNSAAGITKLFTAAAILTLARDKGFSVHDSLSQWTGALPAGKSAVTLHQLLTHTDGLTRQSAPVYRTDADAFVRAVSGTPSAFAPGAGYRYNDFGHSLLGLVVERASGKSYEEWIQHRFLKPAGLKHTGWESDRGELAIEYGGDRAETRLGPRAYVWGRRGSLGLVTTAGDLYRWFRAMNTPSILPPEVKAQMLEQQVKTDWGAMQGYGWDFHHRSDGRVIWRRVAGTPGFEGEILHDPVGGWTAVILVNSRIGWRFKVWDAIERAALLSALNR